MRKLFTILFVSALLGLLGWQIYQKIQKVTQSSQGNRGQKTVTVAVEVTPVQRDTIRHIGLFTGTLFPRSQFKVAPKIEGRLQKLHVHIGDSVKQDQLIAVLDSEEITQQVKREQAELKIAEAQLKAVEILYPKRIAKTKADAARWAASAELAKKELSRQLELRKNTLGSVTEYDQAHERFMVAEAQLEAAQKEYELIAAEYEGERRKAQAEVERAQAVLNSVKVRLSYSQIKAHWENGTSHRVVGERFVDEGVLLKIGDPIVSILDIDALIATIHVTEKDYAKVSIGQTVEIFTDAISGTAFPGKIIRIAPMLQQASREARVDIEVKNPKRKLKPGMFIRAKIEFARHDQAIVVPRSAVVSRNDREGVFLVDEAASQAKFIAVQSGIVSATAVEITSPEIAGKVVVLGHHLLSDGMTVLVSEKKEPVLPVVEE